MTFFLVHVSLVCAPSLHSPDLSLTAGSILVPVSNLGGCFFHSVMVGHNFNQWRLQITPRFQYFASAVQFDWRKHPSVLLLLSNRTAAFPPQYQNPPALTYFSTVAQAAQCLHLCGKRYAAPLAVCKHWQLCCGALILCVRCARGSGTRLQWRLWLKNMPCLREEVLLLWDTWVTPHK